MRTSVYLFCILILAICVELINGVCSKNPPASTPKQAAFVSAMTGLPAEDSPKPTPALAPAQPPPWELRLGEIASQPEWMQSQEELEELADGIPTNQIRAALDVLASDASSAVAIVGRQLTSRWAGQSPEDAAQWAAQLPDNNFGHVVCRQLLASWSEKDPAGAAAWVRQLPDGGNKTAAQLSLGNEAATQGQGASAIALIVEMQPSQERDSLLNYSARQWATASRDDAINWIDQIADPVLRERMLKNVAVDWAVSDPVSAGGFAATALTTPATQENAIIDIVRFWSASAPDDAAAWVSSFPSGPLRDASWQAVTESRQKAHPQ